MLSVLTAHIIITLSCLCSGFLFYKILPEKNEAKPIIFYLISGLIFLTVFTQIIVLFFPVGQYTQLSLLAILLLIVIFRWKDFGQLYKKILSELSSWSTLTQVLFFITWLIIILLNAGPV